MVRYKTHIIKQGETVQSISQMETGDVSNWQAIVTQNDLRYPYIVPTIDKKMTDVEHLVTLGDTLVIPYVRNILDDVDPSSLSKRDQELILSVALGRDLFTLSDTTNIDTYGTSDELVGLSSLTNGDIATVYGVENVKQSAIMRLSTARGSLLLHPEYGSDLYKLFGKATYEQMQLIAIEVVRTILSDSRITSCSLQSHYIEGNKYHGEYTAVIQDLDASFKIFIEGDSSGNIILL